jgi:putative hemolysin
MAEEGRPGARTALALASDPGRFLSTVQIGITLVGVLAGAFSGAAGWLAWVSLSPSLTLPGSVAWSLW